MAIGHHVQRANAEKAAAMEPNVDPQISDQEADALIADIETTAAPAPPSFSMDQVMALLAASQNQGFTSDDLKALLSEVMAANAKANANAMQTAFNRSNPDYITRSPYHDADGKEAHPIYDVYMGPQHTKGKGGHLPKDMFTPAERDLINRFVPGERKTARNGDWSAEVVRDGSTQELIVKVPMYTHDQRQNLPSFTMILKELLDGEVATNPERLAEQVDALRRRIAELETKPAATVAA